MTPRTSASTLRTSQRTIDDSEKKAALEDAKVAVAATKLGQLSKELSAAHSNLDRALQSTTRREDTKRKTEFRRTKREDLRRRQTETAHAREVGRLSSSTIRYVHEVRVIPEPKPEVLRVLYMTANPEGDLRTEVEVRDVRQAVRSATHRDLIEIAYRPAATPEDLIDGLNELRPHVVHFSGHAGSAAVLFDNASVDSPEGREVTFALLARVLGATSTPPVLLVLNGCDTLDGAEVLLDSTPVIVAMATEITDLAASVFAARFYAAISSAQPVGAAVRQGAVALDLAGLGEGWKPQVLSRSEVDLEDLVLIKPPAS